MREIKFRGKRLNNGEWVFGWVSFQHKRAFIHRDDMPYDNVVEVEPATVGQFTGMKDKSRREIYEGDILRFDDTGEEGYEYKEGFDFINMAVVIWHDGRFKLDKFASTNSGVLDEMNHCHEDFIFVFSGAEVDGNIYDNKMKNIDIVR